MLHKVLPKPKFSRLPCSAGKRMADTTLSRDMSFSEAVLLVVADPNEAGTEDTAFEAQYSEYNLSPTSGGQEGSSG